MLAEMRLLEDFSRGQQWAFSYKVLRGNGLFIPGQDAFLLVSRFVGHTLF
jgi:hypothetical protein